MLAPKGKPLAANNTDSGEKKVQKGPEELREG